MAALYRKGSDNRLYGKHRHFRSAEYSPIMNYRYQLGGISTAGTPGSVEPAGGNRPDFSHVALTSLTENNLDENAGLYIASPLSPHGLDIVTYYCPDLRSGPGFGPIDWNCNGAPGDVIMPPQPPVDINGDHRITPLAGYDDWSHLDYAFQCTSSFLDGAPPPDQIATDEVTLQTAMEEHVLLPMAQPRLVIRPGCGRNWVFLGSNAALPVTLYGSADFDVTRIVLSSLRLTGAAPVSTTFVDQDGDGRLDLSAGFKQSSMKVTANSTLATLTGYLDTSQAFEATDSVSVSTARPRAGSCPKP
jgi:hypothetical protein